MSIIDIRVIPRAKRTEIVGIRDGALVVKVAAPPVEGAANDAVMDVLAERLRLPRRSIRIVAGATSRRKRVEIAGATPDEIRALE